MDAKHDLIPVTVNAEVAARLLGISRSSVFGLIQKKSIPSMIIAGRRVIRYSDLQAFADQQSVAADPNALGRSIQAARAVRSKRRSSPTGTAH